MKFEFRIEAAMCLWEEVMNLISAKKGHWHAAAENLGYGELRLQTSEWVEPLMTDWKTVENEFDRCFDWDFVPEWIHNNVILTADLDLSLRDERIIPAGRCTASAAPATQPAADASAPLQTIRLLVQVRADPRVDPETVRGNAAAAIDLTIAHGELDDGDVEEGRIAGATVTIDETPRDEDGPFALFVGPQGEISEESTKSFETWSAAQVAAQSYEDSGYFAEIQNASGLTVYSTEG